MNFLILHLDLIPGDSAMPLPPNLASLDRTQTQEQLGYTAKAFDQLFMIHKLLKFYIDKIVLQNEVDDKIDTNDLIMIINLARDLKQWQNDLDIYMMSCTLANNIIKHINQDSRFAHNQTMRTHNES
ncbi:uncharacterized protein MELLADRAFT_59852 [Melampsora larici-populina 98AG31]|uniref:Uncharacterized protein n=1 Tax=Melampsora larici-populina (strain 98AG31 / pathotype 3-4-7) TaxID=747676 RepID=F4R913_MELLP|nr:uncharacterized protein MELLADRAFT_59852 [Melampsora larici-populina 98AG31]EGG11236.1 hypothetical protein MELLADRAFT_59852 [Melampsora larici-populina 98AG31]